MTERRGPASCKEATPQTRRKRRRSTILQPRPELA